MTAAPVRILVDVGHPAHVHFFRHPLAAWREAGHAVTVTARDKDVALELLAALGIPHRTLGRPGRGTAGLARELVVRVARLARQARRAGADVITAIGGSFVAPAAFLARVPSVVFTDTEHVATDRVLTRPFASVLYTPDCFRRDLGPRHRRYRGLHELAYLHPARFRPDPAVRAEAGLGPGERFAVVRLIAWSAGHDAGHHGFDAAEREALVAELSRHLRVLVSGEGELPPALARLRVPLPAHRMHHLLAAADLYVGEGATMATEAALLGTPAVYVSTLAGTMGNMAALAEAGLLVETADGAAGVRAAAALAASPGARADRLARRDRFVAERLDVADFVAAEVVAWARRGRR